jgi:uncharacterized protein involved in exopolysaccharide biosynthesis
VDPLHTPAPDEFSLADFVRPLARRWRPIVLASLAGAALALALTLVWPRSYAAEVTFTPEQASGGGALGDALGGLGASGGIGSLVGSVGGMSGALGGASASPDFFAQLLMSRELLVSTLQSPFPDPERPGQRRPLLELLKPSGATPERRLGNARRKLARKAAVTLERRSGIVTLTVTLPDARLAADVANRMAELLNVYNLERRQSTSREQRRFVEARLRQAEEELRVAEQARTSFLRENRFFQGSPALAEQAVRFSRDVAVQQELVLGLRSAFEDARIAEVRNTPVLSIVDHAAPPDRPASPRPLIFGAVGALLGGMLAAGAALLTRRPAGAVAVRAADRGADGLQLRGVSDTPAASGDVAAARPEGWAGPRRSAERP